jgi:hypothetical protein
MKEYVTNKGQIIKMDDDVYESLGMHDWWVKSCGYVQTKIEGKYYTLHRLVMSAKPGQVVDHKSGDRLDNQRCNLRFCTVQENNRNQKPLRDREYKGVSLVRRSGLYCCAVSRHVKGLFSCKEAAANCYNHFAKQYYGEFAWLNKVRIEMEPDEWNALRVVSERQFIGVEQTAHGKFRAQIVVDRRQEHLGCFETAEEAARAYDERVRQIGSKRRVNFPCLVHIHTAGPATGEDAA